MILFQGPLQETPYPLALIIGTDTAPDPLVALFSQRFQVPQGRHFRQPTHGLDHILNANTVGQVGSGQQMLNEVGSLQVRQRQPKPEMSDTLLLR